MAEPRTEWRRGVGADEVAEGEVVGVVVAGRGLTICRVDGAFYAVSDTCTHQGAPLSDGALFGCFLECPYHNGRFDIRTGKAVTHPVTRDIRTYPVRVVGGDVEVLVRV